MFDITIAVLTVLMEAGGEPRRGKLGVAYVLVNRMHAGRSMTDVILDPWDFSCWNTDSPTRMNLDKADDALYAECLSCVLAAMFGLETDPTSGAYFYMNKDVVIATAGKLPAWWDSDTIHDSEITIGHHSFRGKK
jgi:hypothetical protein